jgi:hypothetical protein
VTIARVLATISIFGNRAHINPGGGNKIIVLNWISTSHAIAQLGDDILVAWSARAALRAAHPAQARRI